MEKPSEYIDDVRKDIETAVREKLAEDEQRDFEENVSVKELLEELIICIKSLKTEFPEEMNVWVRNQVKQKEVVAVSNLDEIKLPKMPENISLREAEWIKSYFQEALAPLNKNLMGVASILEKIHVSLKNIRDDLNKAK